MSDDDIKLFEVRVQLPKQDVEVLDALAFHEGSDRTTIVRTLVRERVEKEIHRAILVCRTAGVDPRSPDADRRVAGK